MDIETRIQELLMKASPVNDNSSKIKDDCISQTRDILGCIDIKGNNNIVIKFDWLTLFSLLWLIGALLITH